MEPSASLKRKRISQPLSSSAFSGTFTRSKSQIYVHHNRSGRARTDSSRKPVHQYYDLTQSVGEVAGENQEIPIKDLRLRRVFPTGPARPGPARNEIGDDLDGFWEGIEEGVKIDNGLVKNVVCDGKSFSGFCVENKEENVDSLEARNDENLVISGKSVYDFGVEKEVEKVEILGDENEGNLVIGGKSVSDFGVGNEEENVDMVEARNEGNVVSDGKSLSDFGVGNGGEEVDTVEARNDENLVEKVVAFNEGEQMKGANSSNKVVANIRPTKVFVAPGSFNYRRLLPFLEDIKPSQTATSKMGIVDGKSQSNLSQGSHESHGQKLSNINEQSVTENSTSVGHKGSSQISNDEKTGDAESHKFGVLPSTERDISGIVNNEADPVIGDSLLNNEHINGDVEQLKGSNSSNKVVANMRPRKLFKPPGSFSYRRLLPFLEDTEKDRTTSSKIEIVKEKSPSNLRNQNLENYNQDAKVMAMDVQSVTGYCTRAPCKGSSESSHDERTGNAEAHKFGVQPIAELDISDVVNNDVDSVFGLVNNESVKNDLDDPTMIDHLIEEYLQSTQGQDIQLSVSNHAGTASGDRILNNGESKDYLNGLNGVNDSKEEYVQSVSEQDLSRVIKNIADSVLGDGILNGSMKNDCDGMTGVSELQEVDVQMTPPDAVIFTTPEIEAYPQDMTGKGCVTKSVLPRHTSNSVMFTNGTCNINLSSTSANQSNVTPSNAGMVLNPCSRQRVFKPSGSFSYRRLLPYLTSVSGDQHPGLVKTSKEGSSTNHFKPERSPKMQKARENKDNQPVHSPIPSASSLNSDSGSNSSDLMPRSVTSTSINDHLKVHDVQSEEPLKAVNTESNFLSELNPELSILKEASLHSNISSHSFNQNTAVTNSKKEVSRNELDGNGSDFMHVDNEQLGGTIITKESPSKDLLLNPKSHLNGSQKGILKRNPRGCRGLCDCLNCASFRLHAERTFEFSRNQLQDAEEVAFDLVKELSSLRQVLERSTAEATDPTIIHLNQVQVKEACRKALEAEKLAKERLNEMNEDLSNHCRTKNLSRPRVTFLSKKPRNE